MTKKILSVILLIAITITLPACGQAESGATKLTYYVLKENIESEAWFYKLIEKYNKYCINNLDESYQIDVITFEICITCDYRHRHTCAVAYGVLDIRFQYLHNIKVYTIR